MAQLVLLVLAGLTGFVGYHEAAKHEKRFRKGPWGISALLWGVVCFFFGLVGALLASALVIGALTGFVGYHEAAKHERQNREGPWGISALLWGVVCCCFGLVGALVTSTLVWGVVCSFLGLVGALLLLTAEKNTLIAEKDALLAEKNTRGRGAASNHSAPPAHPVAAAPPPPQQSAPPPQRWGSVPSRPSAPQPQRRAPSTSSGWSQPQPSAPGARDVGGSDLLPHR
jgi:hypothetical protein